VAGTGSVSASSTPTPTETAIPSTGTFYVDPHTRAAAEAAAAAGTDKTLLDKIALNPAAHWVGNVADAAHSQGEVRTVTSDALAAGRTALLVVYAIPGRDCGNFSSGGVATSEYATWIDTVAAGIQGKPWIILEPDALAQLGDCAGQGDRVGYLKYAARALTQAGARVYLDAGNSGWLSAATAADRLAQVGFEYAVGFALNTSNYMTTSAETAYGQQISAMVGGKTFVIDTSRNGNGSNGEWCNPSGRALGERATLVGAGSVDAYVWAKVPGESDGACHGGPAAGQWFASMALELARNAAW
jgi:endoglucanase